MANAGFGLPSPIVVSVASGGEVRPASNLTNDEVGLIYESSPVTTGSTIQLKFTCSDPISFIALMGVEFNGTIQFIRYASQANMDAGTSGTTIFTGQAPLSTSKSSTHFKFFETFAAVSTGFYRIVISQTSGATNPIRFWRLLAGTWISPADNIEVQAQSSIDDRSARRYSSIGRRNFTRYGVYPSFTGKWPWLSKTEYDTMIRPMMLKYGSSIPVLFCLDYDDATWGQDTLFYGDLERDQVIIHDDGQLYGYGFTLVDIAPVDLTV